MQRDDNQRDLSIKKTLKCKKSKQKIVKTRLVLIYTYIGIKKKKKEPAGSSWKDFKFVQVMLSLDNTARYKSRHCSFFLSTAL